jgi:hypothetical protein
MHRRLVRYALVVAVVAVALLPVGQSAAAVLGPFCWNTPPFSSDVYALTFITDGGNTAAVAGRNVDTNTAVSGAAFLEGDGVTVNMVATVGQESIAGFSAFHFQVRFSNQTGAGTGRCQVVNPAVGGCGTGTNITFVIQTCPVGALAQEGAHSISTGRSSGGGN